MTINAQKSFRRAINTTIGELTLFSCVLHWILSLENYLINMSSVFKRFAWIPPLSPVEKNRIMRNRISFVRPSCALYWQVKRTLLQPVIFEKLNFFFCVTGTQYLEFVYLNLIIFRDLFTRAWLRPLCCTRKINVKNAVVRCDVK